MTIKKKKGIWFLDIRIDDVCRIRREIGPSKRKAQAELDRVKAGLKKGVRLRFKAH